MQRDNPVLKTWSVTSDEIAKAFDNVFRQDINELSQEMCATFDILDQLIHEVKSPLADNDLQSAFLYWGALNTIISAVDLSRRGYTKEPQMLMRNVLEIFAVAFDVHENIERYYLYKNNPDKFESTKSIPVVKKVSPFVAYQYGILSTHFTHVGQLHTLPHKEIGGFAVGGMFNPDDVAIETMNIAMIIGTFDVLNSLIELTFIRRITNLKYWKKTDASTYEYSANLDKLNKVLERVKKASTTLAT